jgi:hypothetical protein
MDRVLFEDVLQLKIIEAWILDISLIPLKFINNKVDNSAILIKHAMSLV